MLLFVLPLIVVALLMLPLLPIYKGVTTGKKARHAMAFNLCAFFGICLLAIILPVGGFVSAAGETTAAAAATGAAGMGYLSMALAVGLSCIGAGIAVAAAAPAAIGAIGENPKLFGKSIIFVALGEAVALYGLLVAILIFTKL